MLRRVFAIILPAVLLPGLGACAEDGPWRTVRTTHFIIYYANGADSVARNAGSSAERWHSILSRKLDYSPGGVTPIYLYPDRRSFARAARIDPADTVVGLAHTRTLKVRVDASGTFASPETVIAHELVHVFISRRLRGYAHHMPLWMHEGLAKYLAGDWTHADAELLREVGSRSGIIPLGRISHVFPKDDRRRGIAYVESYSIVKYIADKYTPESIPDILAELAAGHPFPTALLYSIGVEPDVLERDWRQYLWEEYRPYRWFRLASAILSAAMAAFAILAFRSRIRRKRLKAAEFEEEVVGIREQGEEF